MLRGRIFTLRGVIALQWRANVSTRILSGVLALPSRREWEVTSPYMPRVCGWGDLDTVTMKQTDTQTTWLSHSIGFMHHKGLWLFHQSLLMCSWLLQVWWTKGGWSNPNSTQVFEQAEGYSPVSFETWFLIIFQVGTDQIRNQYWMPIGTYFTYRISDYCFNPDLYKKSVQKQPKCCSTHLHWTVNPP